MSRAAKAAIGLFVTFVSLLTLAGNAHASTTYYYAGAFESSISVGGIKASMRVSNPYLQGNSGEHSLMEIAVRDDTPDTSVEFGWIKDQGAGGGPKLFTYYHDHGTKVACWFGCAAWHDNAGNATNLGTDLSTVATSCVGSSLACIKQFQIEYRASACGASAAGIFLTYDGTDVGCLDSASVTSSTFTTSFAYGEVYYAGGTVPCTDMGNGKFGNSGPYNSLSPAVIQSVTYLGTATNPNLSFLTPTDTNAYTAVGNGSTGNRTFSVGGPGYTSTGTSPGNTGSC